MTDEQPRGEEQVSPKEKAQAVGAGGFETLQRRAEDGPEPARPAGADQASNKAAPEPVVPTLEPGWRQTAQPILDRCEQLKAGMAAQEKAVQLLQITVAQLSHKLDDVTTSFSEPRIRDILCSLLLLNDLLEQMSDTAQVADGAKDHRRNYGVLLSQIRQVLALNGIEVIPTDIPFDENMHKAVSSIETEDLSEDGRIVKVFRQGFRSSRRTLRFADVQVKVGSARARGQKTVRGTDAVEGTSAEGSALANTD